MPKSKKLKKLEIKNKKSIEAGDGTMIKDTSVLHIVRNKRKEPKIIEKYTMKHLKKFNEHKNVEMNIIGLKCDNPDCDYNDDTIPFEDYEKYINKPCPKCGENLLTQEDYDETMDLMGAMDMINSFSQKDLEKIVGNFSEEEMDGALDVINRLKMKKISDENDGSSIWSMNPRAKK